MRTAWKKIRYRLEWLALKSATKFVPFLSRNACYRLALFLGSLGAGALLLEIRPGSLRRLGSHTSYTTLGVLGSNLTTQEPVEFVGHG